MNLAEIKKLIITSLGEDAESTAASSKLKDQLLSFDFENNFTGKILSRVYSSEMPSVKQMEFTRYLGIAFSRIAISGVAAIILLLISIFLMEGDLSLNSILGIGDSQTESIVCLLTGM